MNSSELAVRLSMMQSELLTFELMQWLNITNEPIKEFHAPDGLTSQEFPILLYW